MRTNVPGHRRPAPIYLLYPVAAGPVRSTWRTPAVHGPFRAYLGRTPSGPGRLLFAFFAAMAETERENIRESTLEGLDAAARKGRHGGRPQVITDDMLHTVLRRRAAGESVEVIAPDVIIGTGKRK